MRLAHALSIHRRGVALALAGLALAALALAPRAGADSATPEIFRGADLVLGEQLLKTHRCAECHTRHVGGDGSDIYNPQGRISTPGALRGMVDLCSTELKLQLFPEEVTAVAAVLNRDHYRFGAR
ncbi:MAG: hypothetical protein JNL87_00585 [Burkholderiaceae bacterium]|nr:hypothetical protein [Burkholderiaceae bacterium]